MDGSGKKMHSGKKFGWTLVCLTSTRHRRFVEDIVAVSALPIGSSWRFRYRRKYVDPALLVLTDSPQAKGVHMVLGVAGFEQSGASALIPFIEPVREAYVDAVIGAGDLIVIDFTLGNYCKEATPNALRTHLSKDGSTLPYTVEGAAPQGWFCTITQEPSCVIASGDVRAWEDSARTVLSRTDESHVPFAFGINIRKKSGSGLNRGVLTVQAGSQLGIEVQTILRENKSSPPLAAALGEIKLDVAHASMTLTSSGTVRVDTHRNAKSILLQCAPSFRQTLGHLSFRAHSFVGSASDEKKEKEVQVDRDTKRPALVRLDIPLSSGGRSTWLFSVAAALVITLSSISVDAKSHPRLDKVRVAAIAALTVYGLRRGLSLKG